MRIPFLLLPLFVCASVAAQKPCARYSFDAPRVYAPEGFHHRNVIADFDGDGRLDIGSTEDGRFSLRFQDASGAFGSAETLGGWVWSAGDVIGDPLPDLLANGEIMENLGGRRFAPPIPLPVRGRNIAGDFTGDGRSDLLIAHSPNQLLLMRRTAAGTLEPSTQSTLGDDYGFAVVKGDFDGDGLPDLAAPASAGGSVRVFRNEGEGRFTPGAVYTTTARPEVIEAADLDRDGRSDVIALVNLPAAGGTTIEVFYASGRSATFAVSGYHIEGVRLLVDHFNPDTAPDLIVSVLGPQFRGLYTFINDGFGGLRDVSHVQLWTVYDIASGDLTGDGHTDLMVPRVFGQEVMPGTGNGRFASPRALSNVIAVPDRVVDLDGDGADELVYLGAGRITVRWNDGKGTYRAETLPQTGISYLTSSAAGLAAYDSSNRLLYVLTRVNGAWNERKIWSSPQGFPTMRVADLDRDGAPEVVTIDQLYGLGNTISVTSGKEDRSLFSLFFPGVHIGTSAMFDDMNGDGLLDLLVAFSGTQDPAWGVPRGMPQQDGSIAIFTGTGAGTFGRGADALTNASPRTISTGDFNGDGRRDVAALTYDSKVLVSYGAPSGYTAPHLLMESFYPLSFTTSDFDGNGITDVVVASADSFVNFRGTTAGLVEDGRFSSTYGLGPVAVRLRANAPASLLVRRGTQPLVIDTICTSMRRRSVR